MQQGKPKPERLRRRQRGSALLAVLWLSAVLAAIAFALAGSVQGEAERASTAVESARAYYLACGAVQRATLRMLWGPQDTGTGGNPHPAIPGSGMLALQFPTGDANVEVVPESAKININTAPPELLFRLLTNLGVAPDRARTIALAIVDWRSGAPNGSPFDQYYLSLVPSFRARHASIEEIEELLLVQGMTPEIFYGSYDTVPQTDGRTRLVPRPALRDCVTVFGTQAQYDINTAPQAVLAAIGVPPDVVAAVIQRRQIAPFRAQDLGPIAAAAGPNAGMLTVGGNSIFTVRATASVRLSNGQPSDLKRTVAAMVKFMPPGYDAPYHILRWYDNAWTY
jgi:general secretion pathway protein K